MYRNAPPQKAKTLASVTHKATMYVQESRPKKAEVRQQKTQNNNQPRRQPVCRLNNQYDGNWIKHPPPKPNQFAGNWTSRKNKIVLNQWNNHAAPFLAILSLWTDPDAASLPETFLKVCQLRPYPTPLGQISPYDGYVPEKYL